ncbi:MAG: hypothetical protein ORN98_04525 [Alphaproteobacteria bacterium]|nr:hypothetical protein [Alphaproteobacteria bacterium]
MSRIAKEMYENAKGLYKAGLMSEETLRQFSGYKLEQERKQKRNAKARAQAEKIHAETSVLRSPTL